MDTPMPGYVYRARLAKVTDGDTQVYVCDVGFYVAVTVHARHLGINCPELRGATRPAGLAAKAFAADWLAGAASGVDWPLTLVTRKAADVEKFGRWLGVVYRGDDPAPLNQALIDAGHAVGYDGTGPRT